MIVEEISYSDKYNLVRLTISGERFLVDYDFYHNHSLSKGDELDFDLYKKILRLDDYNRAKNLALKKLSYSQKSTHEIRKKLREKKFSDDVIDDVIEFLDSYGFLNDRAYVKSYIRDKDELSKWSKRKISYKLRAKNIDESLIDEYLSLIDDDRELEKAEFFARKKARDDFSYENRQKVFRHLAGKGFEIDIINRALDEIFS